MQSGKKSPKKVTIEDKPIRLASFESLASLKSQQKHNKSNINKIQSNEKVKFSSVLNRSDSDQEVTENGEKCHNNKRVLSDFFRASRVKPKSIKLPECNISRGLVLAIVFFLLFGLIILWFFFSSDSFDLDEDYDLKFNQKNFFKKHNRFYSNKTNRSKQSNDHLLSPIDISDDKTELSTKLFVLFSTVFIVLSIISFVFIGALIHYFKKPKSSYDSSRRSQSIVSSIFSHHNHHNHLYYLDKHSNEEESSSAVIKLKKTKSKSKSKSKSKDDIGQQLRLPPPLIVINESN